MQVLRLSGPFTHNGGNAFTVPMPSSVRRSAGSRFVLIEDDEPMGPADAVHDVIRHDGAGRYSVWPPLIYFSASDNSDPNKNGRVYRLVHIDAGPGSALHKDILRAIAHDDADVLRTVNENLSLNNSIFSNFFRYHRTILQPLQRNEIPIPASM